MVSTNMLCANLSDDSRTSLLAAIENDRDESTAGRIWAFVPISSMVNTPSWGAASRSRPMSPRCWPRDRKRWWRRRESNPRPQALRPRLYMLSPPFVLTASNPTDRARSTASPLNCLTTRRRTRFVASL